jgi:Raf kinase inhibitor-like YbhB/YbcL family protein
MKFEIQSFENGARIPGDYAFCIPAEVGHVALAPNKSPHMLWSDAPKSTKSYAMICVDISVPSVGDDVNQEGKTISKDLPRVDFYHLVLCDIPTSYSEFKPGELCDGVTARGKNPGTEKFGVQGINDYTSWFSGDPDMEGFYGGYDGPCPPWNDELVHEYHIKIFALDVDSLELSGNFNGADLIDKMQGHILDEAMWTGTYTFIKD